MKVDVVIPLSNKSKKRDDFELRYSLRSLVNQEWIRNIYIIGHRPDWINYGNRIYHTPCADPFNPKDANIINKINQAVSVFNLTDSFVITSDDHYILRSVQLDDLGPYLENANVLPRQKSIASFQGLWKKRQRATLDYCKAHKFPGHIWESHIPYLVDKSKWKYFVENTPWDKGNGLLTHIYFNINCSIVSTRTPKDMVVRVKSTLNTIGITEFNRLVLKALFLNHNDSGLCPTVKEYLEYKFPNKAEWEL